MKNYFFHQLLPFSRGCPKTMIVSGHRGILFTMTMTIGYDFSCI